MNSEIKTAKQFCEDYQSEAKYLIKGIGDPLLHTMMEEYASEHKTKINDLDREIERLRDVVRAFEQTVDGQSKELVRENMYLRQDYASLKKEAEKSEELIDKLVDLHKKDRDKITELQSNPSELDVDKLSTELCEEYIPRQFSLSAYKENEVLQLKFAWERGATVMANTLINRGYIKSKLSKSHLSKPNIACECELRNSEDKMLCDENCKLKQEKTKCLLHDWDEGHNGVSKCKKCGAYSA